MRSPLLSRALFVPAISTSPCLAAGPEAPPRRSMLHCIKFSAGDQCPCARTLSTGIVIERWRGVNEGRRP
jgi:hypothetical protein